LQNRAKQFHCKSILIELRLQKLPCPDFLPVTKSTNMLKTIYLSLAVASAEQARKHRDEKKWETRIETTKWDDIIRKKIKKTNTPASNWLLTAIL